MLCYRHNCARHWTNNMVRWEKHQVVAVRVLANQVYLFFYSTVVINNVYLNMIVLLYTKPVPAFPSCAFS